MKHINILSIALLFFLFMNSCGDTKHAAGDDTISRARWYEKDSANQIIGENQRGPFRPAKKIWETPEIYEGIDYHTYSAKAHPQLSKPGELLINYNINSFQFENTSQFLSFQDL